MKSLYISGTYCPSTGGAEISAHSLLKGLQEEENIETLVLTDEKYVDKETKKGEYEGIQLKGTQHEEREDSIRELIQEYQPDFILTQLLWSDVALKIAKEEGIKSVLRVCKTPFSLDITQRSDYSPSQIMVVSKSVKNYVQKEHERESEVFPSIIKLEKIVSKGNKEANPYILMFNNLVRKGAGTFSKIAQLMPEEEFAIVPGWNILKEKEKFNYTLIKNMCESMGDTYTGKKPAIVESFPTNVTILQEDFDVRNIYAQTRILCVPSIWEEAFGRVAIEGFANEIPVLASAVGGLQEHAGRGGKVIKDYKNPEAWVKELKELQDPSVYQSFVERGRTFLQNEYNTREIIRRFSEWVK